MIDEKKLIEELKLSNYHHVSNSREQSLLDRVLRIIEEQPKIENTINFKHFHLLADSILKTCDKEALLEYIHSLHRNWEASDMQCNIAMQYASRLDEILDRACEKLEYLDKEYCSVLADEYPDYVSKKDYFSEEKWRKELMNDD